MTEQPGRACPLHYRYAPAVFNRAAEIHAQTLYVIGGLYGNPFALKTILALAELETPPPTLVFNGDFNWFNIDDAGFSDINRAVLQHHALRGNVETELNDSEDSAGCGCAYPESVSDREVAYSNEIMARLQATAGNFADIRLRLASLPMHLVAEVGGMRIAIVHGDAQSLAGWDFSRESLADPAMQSHYQQQFSDANADIFASTHTCLPAIKSVPLPSGHGLIVNNGSAGMANLRDSSFGLVTRISTAASQHASQSSTRHGALHIDLLRIDFDLPAWIASFCANWPPESAAYESYFRRITRGPAFSGKLWIG